jgi:hypothetical protein
VSLLDLSHPDDRERLEETLKVLLTNCNELNRSTTIMWRMRVRGSTHSSSPASRWPRCPALPRTLTVPQ